MAYKLRMEVRNSLISQFLTYFEAVGGAGVLRIYDGLQPAGPASAITSQVLLAELTLSDPVGTVLGAVLTFGDITGDSSANATGTATWARVFRGDGQAVLDVDVSDASGPAALKLEDPEIVGGLPVIVTSFSITMGGG